MKNIKNEYISEENFEGVRFYHGTSSVFKIERLLPSLETGILREGWRKTLCDKVFFTDSLMSAHGYAKKAAKKFGGEPVVYEVSPVGDIWHLANNEYVSDEATIVSRAG